MINLFTSKGSLNIFIIGSLNVAVIFYAVTAFLFAPIIASAQVSAVFDEFSCEVAGNEESKARIRLITDNQQSWYARWHLIENAKESVDCTYFIIEDDAFGRSFLGLLLKKANEGVKLRFMIDCRGSMGFNRFSAEYDFLQELVEHKNIEIKEFNPISSQLLSVFKNLRYPIASNHDKIIIVDKRWIVIGGRNISKDYLASPLDHSGAWRDTDVMIEGEAVAKQAQQAFDEEFFRMNNLQVKEDFINFKSKIQSLNIARRIMKNTMSGNALPDIDKFKDVDDILWMVEEMAHYPSLTEYLSFEPWQGQRIYPVCILDKHCFLGDKNEISPNILKLIDGAQKSIYIQNPYIVLTSTARAALVRAADRGVRIVFSTNSPASTDSLLTQAFFLLDWKDLLKDMPTAEIHCFRKNTQLHSKVFCFDDEVSVIGTYNMDPLSEKTNSEVVVAVKSKAFSVRNRLRIENDIATSIEYKIQVLVNGSIKVIVGPESHVSPKILKKIKRLQLLGFLRPLI